MAWAQDAPQDDSPVAQPPVITLPVDQNDPGVIRARHELEQINRLVQSGALPVARLRKAQENVQDAGDMSLLKKSLYSTDLLPDQVDQMIYLAQRMVFRRQKWMSEAKEMAAAGVLSRAEAEATQADLDRFQNELNLATERAQLIQQIAVNVRMQKSMVDIENEALSHPDWAGKVYIKYDGSGQFTQADRSSVELAFATKFARRLPISADGQTALHRSFGFDHRGRVDVALNPDQPEGLWLMHYLESKHIPYFAFRTAVAHQATGAHIHMGPGSSKLAFNE